MANPTAPLFGIQSRRDARDRHPAGCGGERSFPRVVVVSRICAFARCDGCIARPSSPDNPVEPRRKGEQRYGASAAGATYIRHVYPDRRDFRANGG